MVNLFQDLSVDPMAQNHTYMDIRSHEPNVQPMSFQHLTRLNFLSEKRFSLEAASFY